MRNFIETGRAFYGAGIVAYGIQQILTGDFRPAILPEFPVWIHKYSVFPYITGVALIVAGVIISGLFKIKGINTKKIFLYVGFSFLALIIICHFPYRFIISPYKAKHLGVWTDALKELAFSGGAFVMAGSFLENTITVGRNNFFECLLEKLIPFGRILFSITMISFGIDHFYYTGTVSAMVPAWFGVPVFWTYFGGVALIGSGTAIILKILIRPIGFLLAGMLFLWFIFLHVPHAIADPSVANGNQIVSAFDALLFSGVALVIANIKNAQVK
ncbi:MAG: hypothetical protein ABI707_00120 [Ferruginibacter sp.]